MNIKELCQKIGGEFIKVNIDSNPDLKVIEGCGDYIGIMLNGNDIEKVNSKAKWIKENSTLLVGWETDYYNSLPQGLDLENINILRLGNKAYEVEMCREIDESGNPVYGIVEIE